MNVTGPDWPSTHSLRAALAEVKSDLVVKWGSGGKNGLEQLEAFKRAGLACPQFTADISEAKQWVKDGHRVFGRRLHHTQGSDIIGAGFRPGKPGTSDTQTLRWITTRKGNRVQRPFRCPGTKAVGERFNPDWLRRDFWVKVIPSTNEFREHVWDGRAIRVGKKVQIGESWRKQLVRSRNNGFHLDYSWKSPSEDFTTRIRTLAKGACEALGYIGGAVDILEGEDGKLYVLEVNSAPSVQDANTLKAYVTAITRWAKREAKKARS